MAVRSGHGRTIAVVITLLVVLGGIFAGATLIYPQRQYIADSIALMVSPADVSVESLVRDTGLNEQAIRRTLATDPQLQQAEAFSESCAGVHADDDTYVLGCYTSADRIFVYNVTDPTFAGILQVTLAHEGLHAVWAKLDPAETDEIGDMLQSWYDSSATPEFVERMSSYSSASESTWRNELHSIVGTEVSEISAELEQYYATVFDDRAQVLTHFANYQQPFLENEQRLAEYEAQITQLQSELEVIRPAYEADVTQYNVDMDALEATRASVDRTDAGQVNAFNARLAELQQQADALEVRRVALNERIDQLNALIEEYNGQLGAQRDLYSSIDSAQAPQTSSE